MRRRRLLGATAGFATVSAGLAGCTDLVGGGGCPEPPADFADALPEGAGYEIRGEPSRTDGGENVERALVASYTGPNGESLLFGLSEYNSAETARSSAQDAIRGDGERVTGYVRTGRYIYFASGPSESAVTEFLRQSEPLGECVETNIEFL